MNLKSNLNFFLVLVFFSFLNSCATYSQEMQTYRNLVHHDQFEEALDELDHTSLKTSSKNSLLYHLEKASLLKKDGRLKEATQEFDKASEEVDFRLTESISQNIATWTLMAGSDAYQGTPLEILNLQNQEALSYIKRGRYKSARVSVKKHITRLDEIQQGYSKNSLPIDPFGHYLAGLVFEANQDIDSARIEYQKSLDYYHDQNIRPPYQIEESLQQLSGASKSKKSIVVICERGDIGFLREKNLNLSNRGIRIDLPIPRYVPSTNNYPPKPVVINGKSQSFELIQNLDQSMYAYHRQQEGKHSAKLTARLATKGALVYKFTEKNQELGVLAQRLLNVGTEKADTRSWQSLPASYYAVRVWLPTENKTVEILGPKDESLIKKFGEANRSQLKIVIFDF